MQFTPASFRAALRLTVLSVILFSASQAQAAAIYLAFSGFDLTVLGVTNLTTGIVNPAEFQISGEAVIVETEDFSFGGGSADALAVPEVIGVDPDNLGIDEGVGSFAGVSGEVVGSGLAGSSAVTDSFLRFANFSATDTYQFDLLLDYFLFADAFATDPFFGFAFSEAFLDVFSDGGLIVSETASAFSNEPTDVIEDFLSFDITLGPGGSDEVTIFADAFGVAAEIPEPSTVWLLGAGAAMLLIGRSRSRQRAGGADRSSASRSFSS